MQVLLVIGTVFPAMAAVLVTFAPVVPHPFHVEMVSVQIDLDSRHSDLRHRFFRQRHGRRHHRHLFCRHLRSRRHLGNRRYLRHGWRHHRHFFGHRRWHRNLLSRRPWDLLGRRPLWSTLFHRDTPFWLRDTVHGMTFTLPAKRQMPIFPTSRVPFFCSLTIWPNRIE